MSSPHLRFPAEYPSVTGRKNVLNRCRHHLNSSVFLLLFQLSVILYLRFAQVISHHQRLISSPRLGFFECPTEASEAWFGVASAVKVSKHPIMSAPSEPSAASPVQEAEAQTNPTESETRKSTTRRPSLHQHASSPIPEVAPILGGVGWVGEPSEKAEHAATAFKHHLSPTVTRTLTHDHEKGHQEEEVHDHDGEPGSAATTVTVVGEETPGESDGESEDEVVYPGGLQLGLLTLGLCLATFTVALGELNLPFS
jgi:hypothetical protein